jgi:SAM-dependent methyltransferase
MSHSLAGPEYIAAMSRRRSDRDDRAAFQELALSLVPAGGAVFDFGCGPGIDARAYAARGLHVRAYDNDPRMCEYFAQHCESEMAVGRVQLQRGSYAEFLAGPPDARRFDLVTANFAPLNLVEDLPALFARFAAMLLPRGRVLASLLNPWFVSDLRYTWWWRHLPRFALRGRYSVRGVDSSITRYSPRLFARLAAPLCYEALFDSRPPRGTSPRRLTAAPTDWPGVAASRYLFISLRGP